MNNRSLEREKGLLTNERRAIVIPGYSANFLQIETMFQVHHIARIQERNELLKHYYLRTQRIPQRTLNSIEQALLEQRQFERNPGVSANHFGKELLAEIPRGAFKTITLNEEKLLQLPYVDNIVGIGASGSGKTTVLVELLKKLATNELSDVTFLKRVTTRLRRDREGEEEGFFITPTDYYFLSEKSYLALGWNKNIREAVPGEAYDPLLHVEYRSVDSRGVETSTPDLAFKYMHPQYGFLYEHTDNMKIFMLPSPAILHKETLIPQTFFQETFFLHIDCPDEIRAKRIKDRDPHMSTKNKAEWKYRTKFDQSDKMKPYAHATIGNYGKNEKKALEEIIQFVKIVKNVRDNLRNDKI